MDWILLRDFFVTVSLSVRAHLVTIQMTLLHRNQLTKAKSQEDFKEAQFTKGTRNTFLSLPQVCCL